MVEFFDRPQPFANRASAVGAVKAKRPRLQFFVADLAIRTRVVGAEQLIFPLDRTVTGRLHLWRHVAGDRKSVAMINGHSNRFAHASADPTANDDAVDDGVNLMHFTSVKLGKVLQVVNATVNAGSHETGFAYFGKDVFVGTFATSNHRRHDHYFGAVRKVH